MTETDIEIFDAIRRRDPAAVRQILERDRAAVASRDDRGITAILYARYTADSATLLALLEVTPELDIFEAAALGNISRLTQLADEISVNTYSADGYTPLHFAAFFGMEAAAGILLARGANVAAVSENEMRVTPLHSAVAGGHFAIAKLLIEHGADVSGRQQGGWTPLHMAAHIGDLDLAQLLTYKGADPGARLDDGRTPLDLAREEGHTLLFDALSRL